MRRIFSIIGLLLVFGSKAFHIVGGEIEFITIAEGLYQINVVQYFDEAQDENPGPEGAVEVFVFSNFNGI